MLDDTGIVVVIVVIFLCIVFPPLGLLLIAFSLYMLVTSFFTKQ